jgi:hypothetical protein
MSETPPDIKNVLRKLQGRYLYPIVRERSDQESDSVGTVKEDIKRAKKSKHTESFQLNLSPKQVSH